jgi:hypothetical protein
MTHPSYDTHGFTTPEAREASEAAVRRMARQQIEKQLRAARKVPATISHPTSNQGQAQLAAAYKRIDELEASLGD